MKNRILILVLIIATVCLFSCTKSATGIEQYNKYLEKVKYSSEHMPKTDQLGDYNNVEIFYKNSSSFFETKTISLVLTYDKASYDKQIEYIEQEYSMYSTSPDLYGTDFQAETNGYTINMVNRKYTLEHNKNALLIGRNPEELKICYLFYYDPDLDVLNDLTEYVNRFFELE